MPTQRIPVGPRARFKERVQPCNMRNSSANRPQIQPPRTVIARLAGVPSSVHENHPWHHAILKLEKVLGRPYRDMKKLDKMTGRCLRAGRDKNYILADAVRKVHSLKNLPLQGRLSQPAPETDQLHFFKSMITGEYYIKAGLRTLDTYQPGRDERQDAKMIMAAAFFIEDPPETDSERNAVKKKDPFASPPAPSAPSGALTVNSPINAHGLTWPPPITAPIMPTPSETQIASALSESHGEHDKSLGEQSITIQVQANEKDINKSFVQINPRKKPNPLECYNLNFGNRIEQAILKIDKWASDWLAGNFGNTDVAWESFEYRLAMSDIIKDCEVFEDDVKMRPYVIPAKRGYEAINAGHFLTKRLREGQQPPTDQFSSASWSRETTNTKKRLKLDHTAELQSGYRATGHGRNVKCLRYSGGISSLHAAMPLHHLAKPDIHNELTSTAHSARTPTTSSPYIKRESTQTPSSSQLQPPSPRQLQPDDRFDSWKELRSSNDKVSSNRSPPDVCMKLRPTTVKAAKLDGSVDQPIAQPKNFAANRGFIALTCSSSNNEKEDSSIETSHRDSSSAARQLNIDLANAQKPQPIKTPPTELLPTSQSRSQDTGFGNYVSTNEKTTTIDIDPHTTVSPFLVAASAFIPASPNTGAAETETRLRLPSNSTLSHLLSITDGARSLKYRSSVPVLSSSSPRYDVAAVHDRVEEE
ncbi:hypothetical protein H2198_001808 [Neophaeococcomyces mojaviensis]|uniref:Uncharacterized protein n=1 Tax=Neophaeococcomyces mojaviensis TaxID=3383035 RepID=A0ACC3AFT2_9EURO|nr:hypothetical protein H2198_001808 [Knufia sp. JES_112]